MLRITHKAVKAKALRWICENADFTGYEDFASVDCSDPHTVCAALLSICHAEKFYSTYPTPGAMLEDWCMGFPPRSIPLHISIAPAPAICSAAGWK